MERLICHDDSHNAVDFFKQHMNDFQPVKKFTAFFDNENFMLTDYQLSNRSIHAVIENQHGYIMEFSNLNCGYGGGGPNATARVLQLLGMEEELSLRLMYYDGLQIQFNSDDSYTPFNINTDVFFNGNVRQKEFSGCNLNKYTIANVITHDVYMLNPEMHNFTGLLNCLHVMQPQEFEYVVGKNACLLNYEDIIDFHQPENRCLRACDPKGVNLIIRGKKFDVKCFIDYSLLQGTINAVYTYLTKNSLFEEYHIGRTTALHSNKFNSFFPEFKILIDLFRHQKNPIHRILTVSDKELKKSVR